MSDFDARGYWERRLTDTYTLDGVGYSGLGQAFNGWMYRVRRHVFLRTVRRVLPRREGLRVLDIGSGTGFYVERWHELGVPSVTGSDLTDTAVENLRARLPADSFLRFDVGGAELTVEEEPFDAISAMDVLFHIVDDESFTRSFANVFELLKPGGLFLFSDNFVHGGAQRGVHQASRSLEDVEAAVSAAGLEVLERRPMFVLLNTPLDSRSRVLHRAWSLLSGAASRSEALGAVGGALAYPVELALVRTVREGPSTELMVCRRPA